MRKVFRVIWSVVLLLFLLFHEKAIYATSASVAFSATAGEYAVGDSFIVTLTAESSSGVRAFQTYVAYDPNVLELVDTGSHVSGNDGLVFISDLDNNSQVCEYHMKFKALQVTEKTEIYISDTIYMYSLSEEEQMSVSKNSLKLKINEQQKTKESNQGLSVLEVNKGELTPAFSREVQEYKLDVEADVDTLFVEAKPSLEVDQVKIEGNENLKMGENVVTVTVANRDGVNKVYTILVNKKQKQKKKGKEEEEQTNLPNSNQCKVFMGEDGLMHMTNSTNLKIVPVPDTSQIPRYFEEVKIELDGREVAAYAPKSDLTSDFVLLYGNLGNGEAKFYQYDRIEQTLQRYVDGKIVVEEGTQADNPLSVGNYVFGIVIVILGICISVVLFKIGKDLRSRR